MNYDMFDDEQDAGIPIELPDSEIILYQSFFSTSESSYFMSALLEEIAWKQEQITLYGQVHDLPRLTAWYGEPNKTYMYSGIKVESTPWTPILEKIKTKVKEVSGVEFNSVLLNRYRTGSDGVSWHSDDERELGHNPVIGSVSFGQTRRFTLKHRSNKKQKRAIDLENGSYLLMKGPTQHQWLHQISKSKTPMSERINLTFRVIN